MDESSGSNPVRRAILELVGHGHTAAQIRERLSGQAHERDLRYADSLVKVRDEMRSEKVTPRRVATA